MKIELEEVLKLLRKQAAADCDRVCDPFLKPGAPLCRHGSARVAISRIADAVEALRVCPKQ